MTDYNNHSIDARDLIARLNSLKSNTPDHGGQTLAPNTTIAMRGRPRTPSPSSTTRSSFSLSQHPPFARSPTTSTLSTIDSGMRGGPSTRTFHTTAEIAPGGFSKPRVPLRSQRNQSTNAHHFPAESDNDSPAATTQTQKEKEYPEFRPYGRHANQWLFNDFSITDAVSKGVKRVFQSARDRQHRGEGESSDWFEKRDK